MGVLTDRYGGRLIFSVLLAASALPAMLFGYADSYAALIGVGFLLGIAGASFAVGVPFVSGWYSRERQGFALGVYGIGNIGTAIAFFGAPAIVDHWSRPALGWVTGVALLVGAGLFYSFARNAPRTAPQTRYREVLRSGWRLYRLAVFYFITFGGFVAMAFLLPTLLQDWFGYSKGEASARAAGFIIAATVARPVGGWLSDRFGAYPVLVLVFAGVAIDAAVLAAIAPAPRIVPVSIACLTLGTFLGAGNGAVFKLVPAEFPNDAGAAAGIVGAAGGLGGFFPPVFVGLVKDAEGTYTYGFVGLLVFVGDLPRARRVAAAERPGRANCAAGRHGVPLSRRRFVGGDLGHRLERRSREGARMGVVLPRPLAARPGRPLHPRRQLHRLLLVEDPRQGRDRRLGDAADRLPLQRAGRPRVRAARLPARRLVQLVRVLAAAGAVPVRARRAARPLPGGARRGRATRSRRGRRSSRIRRRRAATRSCAGRAASCVPRGTRSPI